MLFPVLRFLFCMVTRIRSLARRRFQAQTNQLSRRHPSTLVATFTPSSARLYSAGFRSSAVGCQPACLSLFSRRFVYGAGLRGFPVGCQPACLSLFSRRFVYGAGFFESAAGCPSASVSIFSRRIVCGAGFRGSPVGCPPTWLPLRDFFLNYIPSQPSFIFRSSLCHPVSFEHAPNQAPILSGVPHVVNSSFGQVFTGQLASTVPSFAQAYPQPVNRGIGPTGDPGFRVQNRSLQPVDAVARQDLADLIAASRKDPLSEWKLSKFSGESLHWHEWIGLFRSVIDSQRLRSDVKLTYLKTL